MESSVRDFIQPVINGLFICGLKKKLHFWTYWKLGHFVSLMNG